MVHADEYGVRLNPSSRYYAYDGNGKVTGEREKVPVSLPHTEYDPVNKVKEIGGDSDEPHDVPLISAIAANTKYKSVFDKIKLLHGHHPDIRAGLEDNRHYELKESAIKQSFTGLPPEIKAKKEDHMEEVKAKYKPKKFTEFLKGQE
jgi:hypothetical protein